MRVFSFPNPVFYGLLTLGLLIFSGFPATAATLLWLLPSAYLVHRFLPGERDPWTRSVVSTLLALGLFPLLWAFCSLLFPRAPLMVTAVLLLCTLLGVILKTTSPQPAHPRFSPSLILLFLLLLLLTWLPFSRIGRSTPEGNLYRAYFSSDYLKHYAVVETLSRDSLPPGNPYFLGKPLHYYWLPYLFPTAVSRLCGSPEKSLFAWSFLVNFLALNLLFLLLRKRLPLPWALALSTAPFLCSWEGLLHLIRCNFRWIPFWESSRNLNIDGLTRWLYGLPQIDTLYRSLLFTPQHLLSLLFLLLYLHWEGSPKRNPRALSLVLALSLLSSFFVGGFLLLTAAVQFLFVSLRGLIQKRLTWRSVLRNWALLFVPSVLSLVLASVLKMVNPQGSPLLFSPLTPGQAARLLLLNFGPLLVGLIGLFLKGEKEAPFLRFLVLCSLLPLLTLRIVGFESDISLKAGLVLAVALLFLSLPLCQRLSQHPWTFLLLLLFLLPGALTTAIDLRNSSDTSNRRFTLLVPKDEAALWKWIRKNTPKESVVQTFPPLREEVLSESASFGGRRLYVGDRMHGAIFQIPKEEYHGRIQVLESLLASLPESRSALRRLGVTHLFWGARERERFGMVPPLKRVKKIGDALLLGLD